MITPIQKLKPLQEIAGDQKISGVQTATAVPFKSVFESAIDAVKETDQEFAKGKYLLATGQLDNPSSLMIAASKNDTAVKMLVQLRNKAMDAYSEVMRISL